MARHRALSNDARGELERRPRNPFAVDEERALEALQLRYGDTCTCTVRDGTWYAERRGHEVEGSTPDALTHAIFLAWGAR